MPASKIQEGEAHEYAVFHPAQPIQSRWKVMWGHVYLQVCVLKQGYVILTMLLMDRISATYAQLSTPFHPRCMHTLGCLPAVQMMPASVSLLVSWRTGFKTWQRDSPKPLLKFLILSWNLIGGRSQRCVHFLPTSWKNMARPVCLQPTFLPFLLGGWVHFFIWCNSRRGQKQYATMKSRPFNSRQIVPLEGTPFLSYTTLLDGHSTVHPRHQQLQWTRGPCILGLRLWILSLRVWPTPWMKLLTPNLGSLAHCCSWLAVCCIDFAAKVSVNPKKPVYIPLHCDIGRGVMLCFDCRAGGSGGGGRCNTKPPKPLEGDFLFFPLFVWWSLLQGDSARMFGPSFSSAK